MRYAIVDIGSNTVKISVYDDESGTLKQVLRQSSTLGLATYRRDDRLTDEGIHILAATLQEYRHLAAMVSADHLACIATASLRNLLNADEVVARIKELCGMTIDIISGEREAALGFAGLVSAVGVPQDGIFIDLGGASTELITARDGKPTSTVSLPFGALKLYHAHVSSLFPTEAEEDAIRRHVSAALEGYLDGRVVSDEVAYLTGGTAKAIAKLMRLLSPERDGRRAFSVDEFRALAEALRSSDGDFLHRAASRIPERFHMISPGLIALLTIFERYGIKTVHIVYSGIRDGYVAEMCGLRL
jgi:exopolyphosphatase/guanosine-5'-triphosphate,3'-diphosphate pyrophosphatase